MTISVKYKTRENRWSPLLVFETDKDDVSGIEFNYAGEIGSDTVSSATVESENITAGTPSISGQVVSIGLSAGQEYSLAKIEVKMTTAAGNVFTNAVRFRIKDYYGDY